MTHRSICCMPIVTLLVGLLVLSCGFNIIFLEKINKLHHIVNSITSPVNHDELNKIIEEVDRLSKQKYTVDSNTCSDTKYNTRTKEPITNDF